MLHDRKQEGLLRLVNVDEAAHLPALRWIENLQNIFCMLADLEGFLGLISHHREQVVFVLKGLELVRLDCSFCVKLELLL